VHLPGRGDVEYEGPPRAEQRPASYRRARRRPPSRRKRPARPVRPPARQPSRAWFCTARPQPPPTGSAPRRQSTLGAGTAARGRCPPARPASGRRTRRPARWKPCPPRRCTAAPRPRSSCTPTLFLPDFSQPHSSSSSP
jgi:hypothetical protein